MQRTPKVKKLLLQHNIEQSNYSLVLKLKSIVQELQHQLQQQSQVIEHLKKDVKTTKIHQMNIEIQHLNDENQRLLLVIDELKHKQKYSHCYETKKLQVNNRSNGHQVHLFTQIKPENRLDQILKENEQLKRQLLTVKVSQNFIKKRKSTINDRSSIFLQKNLIDFQKLQQQKMDLEAQKKKMQQKMKRMEQTITALAERNQTLEKEHYLQLCIERAA